MEVRIIRHNVAANGFRPVPIYNHDAGFNGAGKAPYGTAWQIAARRDPPAAVTTYNPDATNTGIMCDGLRCIDIDVDEPDRAREILEAARMTCGQGSLVRYRNNSPRMLLVYRAAVDAPKRAIKNKHTGHGVEVLGKGQQFVAYGKHPTGADLQWDDDRAPDTVPLSALPVVTEDQITLLLAVAAAALDIQPEAVPAATNTAAPTATDIPISIEDVVASLAVIPDDGGDYDEWLKVGAGIHSIDNGAEGFSAFDGWSRRSPKYQRNSVIKQWKQYHANPMVSITAGSLIHRAREANPAFITPSLRNHIQAKRAGRPAPTERAGSRFMMSSITDILTMPPPVWLVPGLLLENTVAAIYGPPASFKSFVALDIALSLAAGAEWNGQRLPHSGVVYVAAEGASGLGKRAAAWMQYRGITPPEAMRVVGQPVPLSDQQAVNDLIVELRASASNTGLPNKLIVLDTLARCSVGVDENSAKEMGVVIAAAIRIRAETGATVLLVHHTGKDSSRGMRGSNRLLGDLDTTIEIVRHSDASRVALHVRKQKDAEEGDAIYFEMRKVELPLRAGHPMASSLTPVLLEGAEATKKNDDALQFAEKLPLGEVTSLSKAIDLLGWARGQRAFDRIKSAIPKVAGVTVRTPVGMRRITRVDTKTKDGALLVDEVPE